ncbi:MAG: hypothetical protein KJO29_01895 [Bacteroidia bacterium]|nr:hypothetical protein [Bacteroidia bacterium]
MNVSTYHKTLFGSFIVGLAIIVFHLNYNGSSEESARLVIRFTARFSAVVLALIFATSAIHHFIKRKPTALLLKYRPHAGLVFTSVHTLHLLFLFFLQNQFHPVFTLAKTSSLVAGGGAYMFIYIMAITTYPAIKHRMNALHWKWLHLIGLYWIWAIFFNSYLKKAMSHSEGYFILFLLSAGLLLRVLYLLHQYIHKANKKNPAIDH